MPTTPVWTLALTVLLGLEKIRPATKAGKTQLTGMALCTLCAFAMGLVRGPLIFGDPQSSKGDVRPPSNIPAGVFIMVVQCIFAAAVQIVNKVTLTTHRFPLVSTTAGVALFAVLFLIPCALLLAPAAEWVPSKLLLWAVLYAGLFGTAMNNIILASANRRLGPTTANLVMPLQHLFTAFLDWMVLNDAVYLSAPLCGVGITVGLVLSVKGKQLGDVQEAEIAAKEQESKEAVARGDAEKGRAGTEQ